MPFDIGAGILLTLVVAHLYTTPAEAWMFALGVLFALLPDIDMFWYVLPKISKLHDHRSYPHYPIVWIPVLVFVYLFFSPLIGTLLLCCIVMHLVHDTIGLGWGIAWLWPFSPRKFRFLSPTGNNGRWEFFRTWMPQEERALAELQHDPHWVRTYYLRPNIIGFVEYATLLTGLAALYTYYLI